MQVVAIWAGRVWVRQFFCGDGGWRGGLCFLLSEWRVSTIIVVDQVMWAKVRKRETFGGILCRREGMCGPRDVG